MHFLTQYLSVMSLHFWFVFRLIGATSVNILPVDDWGNVRRFYHPQRMRGSGETGVFSDYDLFFSV